LLAGGVSAVELTFTIPGAADALRAARAAHGDALLLGAGTLRTPEDVRAAVEAGAEYLVAPNLRSDVLDAMLASGCLAIPGTFTPTEVAAAIDAGAEVVKLFPAFLGGPDYLKALRGPFPELKAIPTGAITLDTLNDWFRAGAVAVGVGGELCSREVQNAGKWEEIATRARTFAEKATRR
jgi:2-dehydro-3-deoxyphosphogluconate aldolase/(4S)-4-hydroxy-2-oxoglutarate aldolase